MISWFFGPCSQIHLHTIEAIVGDLYVVCTADQATGLLPLLRNLGVRLRRHLVTHIICLALPHSYTSLLSLLFKHSLLPQPLRFKLFLLGRQSALQLLLLFVPDASLEDLLSLFRDFLRINQTNSLFKDFVVLIARLRHLIDLV